MRKSIQFNGDQVRSEGREAYLHNIPIERNPYLRFTESPDAATAWKLGYVDEAIKHGDMSWRSNV